MDKNYGNKKVYVPLNGSKNRIGGTYNSRRGGSSTIPASSINRYCWHLNRKAEKQREQGKIALISSVAAFKVTILNDPVLRMNFNDHILQKMPEHTSAEGTTFRLLGNNLDQAMDIVNTAATSSPKFEDTDITGVPIYAVFLDYLQTPWGQDFFAHDKVNKGLKAIFDQFSAEVLESEKSLETLDDWLQGPALKYWDPSEYVLDKTQPHMGFQNWNEFFLRLFKEGARPVASDIVDGNDDIITLACESFPLVDPPMPVTNVQATDEFWLKDNKYSIFDMIDAHERGLEDLVPLFVGGTVYQGFLDPWTYHHWHAPVSGTIEKIYNVEGCYYLQNPGIFDETTDDDYINSQPFLSCTSTRQVFIIKADNPHIGRVVVIMIGMCEVSGCVVEAGITENSHVEKGQRIGHFKFGGSSHAVIFEKKCILKFTKAIQDSYYYDLNSNMWLSYRLNINTELARVLHN